MIELAYPTSLEVEEEIEILTELSDYELDRDSDESSYIEE